MDRAKVGREDWSKGSDFLQLNLEDAPAGGRAGWLAGQLRLAVADGRLPVGSRLPASRVLAAELRVSRGVVTEAYQRLTEDGHVAGRGRGGTVVVAGPGRPLSAAGSAAAGGAAAGSAPFAGPPDAAAFDVLRAAPARVNFTPGVPDLAAFPRAAWLRAERVVLGTLAPADFGYGDPRGAPALRAAVTGWLARNRGIRANPDGVIIVSGVAQGLGLLGQVLRRHGIGAVAVEDPGSLGVRQHLQNWGMQTPPVPVDAGGLRVSELCGTGARAVMVTPAHQFPTGVVLDGERRRELIRWASAGGLIIEDDYDAEHRYDRPPVPALRSVLADRVCYAGSMSKLLAPALRVGWLLPPPRYLDALVAAKRHADLGNAVLAQLVLARLMDSGELERQLRFVRRRHRRRRDAMIEAIGTHLPGAVVHGAAAGLHLMVTFGAGFSGAGPSGGEFSGAEFSDAELAAAALARGVKAQPLSWHRQAPGPPGLVLGYAASTSADIADGIAVLGSVLHDLTGRSADGTHRGRSHHSGT